MEEIVSKITGVSDLDWSELAELSGMEIHPDQLRKMGAGIRLAYEAGMLGADAVLPKDTSAHEMQKLRDLRREINEAYRAEARSEALREAVIQAAGQLTPIEFRPMQPIEEGGKRSLLLAVGDMHYGAEWAVKGLMGETINAYSPEVFERRMETLLAETLSILRREGLSHVDLMMCGDAMDGMLRNSQLMKLRWGVVESCMRLSEYLANWIGRLSEFASVRVMNVDGNHSEIRPLGSRKGEFPNENMEKIMAWYLHARLGGHTNVTVDPESTTMKLVEIQGKNVLVAHGDTVKGLDTLAKQAMLLYGKRIDYCICAHKHREQEAVSGYTDDGNTLVLRVPSVCGMDGFAQRLGYGGKAGALCLVMEEGYGRRCMYPIAL